MGLTSTNDKFQITDKNYWNMDYRALARKRIPIIEWLPHYTGSLLFRDVLAGITVTLTSIPQAIALALVAGLSPEYGLYSSFFGGFVYAIFGTCKDLNLGPTSILALMMEPYVSKMGPDAAVFMCFASGVITLLLGLLNLGFVIEFFSYPVIAGFTCAASVEIASTQISNLFGLSHKGDDFLEAWRIFFANIAEVKLLDPILGFVSILALIALRETKRFGSLKWRKDLSKSRNCISFAIFIISLGRNAIIVIFGIALAYNLGDNNPFTLTGDIGGGLPPLQAPPFSTEYNGVKHSFMDIVRNFEASMIFIPLVGILETVTVSKTFADGKSVDATQEILTLGLGNILGSFFRSIPMTGSFTRSAINNSSGVKTPLAGIFTSIFTLLAIAFLTPTFRYVPKPTLAAVMITSMIYLFHWDTFPTLWKNRKLDFLPFFATFFAGLFIKLEYGILIGIGVNLLFILYPTARPKINVKILRDDVIIITPKTTIYFPAADYLREVVVEYSTQIVVVVLDGKYVGNIDITMAKSLVAFTKELTKKDHEIVLWNFKPAVEKVCLGIDDAVRKNFKTGDLEEVLKVIDAGSLV